jgi:stage II sporulation protein M
LFWQNRRDLIYDYLQERFFLFLLVVLLFIMGIVFGALSVNSLGNGQKMELTQYLQVFFAGIKEETRPVSDLSLAKDAIFGHIKTVFFLLVLGISVIGVPLILFLVFTKGYILGFTIGFILQQLAGKGFLFSITSILPHYLLFVPAIILGAVANMDFAGELLKNRWGKLAQPISVEFFRCLGLNGIVLFTLTISGLVEGFISPLFIYWVARLF